MKRLWGEPGIVPKLAVALGAAIMLLGVTPLIPAIAGRLADRWEEPSGEVMVVLGADMLGDGTLGVGSYWRAVYGVRAYRKHPFRKVLLCGGATGSRRSVAEAMGEFMQALGVPEQALVMESGSRSTRENALLAKKLLEAERAGVTLVTSDFHLWRARRAFERAGIRVTAAPFPDIGKRWSSWPQRGACTWDVGTELVKIGYYWAQGWI